MNGCPKGQGRLEASVRDGLRDNKGLAPLGAELRTAGHLMARGYDVDFTDLENRARYDLLVSGGGLEIEVDCKAPSGDVDRHIHKRRFRSVDDKFLPMVRELVRDGGGTLLRIIIPGNLHDNTKRVEELIVECTEAFGAKKPLNSSRRALTGIWRVLI